MALDVVLITTVGQTDIQVVHQVDGQRQRFSIAKEHQRAFHRHCLEGEIRFVVLPLSDCLDIAEERERRLEYDADAARKTLATGISESQPEMIEIDCQERVELCGPLGAQLWQRVKRLQDNGALGSVRAILVLSTRRDDAQAHRQEPIAAAGLLRPPMAEAFGLPAENVRECEFLTRTTSTKTTVGAKGPSRKCGKE